MLVIMTTKTADIKIRPLAYMVNISIPFDTHLRKDISTVGIYVVASMKKSLQTLSQCRFHDLEVFWRQSCFEGYSQELMWVALSGALVFLVG